MNNSEVNPLTHYLIALKNPTTQQEITHKTVTTHIQNLPYITQKLHNLIGLLFTENTKKHDWGLCTLSQHQKTT